MAQKSTFNISNFVKTESSLERLSSLSTSRDLSLGGTKPKKIFVPNLNLTRRLNKSIPKECSATTSSSRYRKGAPRSSVRKLKYDDNRFVQSTVTCGVFSEGTGVEIHKTKSSRFPYKEELPNEISTKKSISTRSHVTFKPELKPVPLDNSVLLDDEDDSVLSNKINDHLPVFIPLASNKRSFSENFKRTFEYSKQDVNLERVPYFTSTNHTLQKTPLLSLVKLPQQFSACKLAESGEIGKILVRESGNVDVLLGNLSYTLDAVDMCPFMETVMTLPTKAEAKTEPDIVDLGTISETLVLCPNWDDLFDRKS